MHLVTIGGNLQHCCHLCVVHNSVGSALLVLTVMGIPEPRSVERVTVQFLRFFYFYTHSQFWDCWQRFNFVAMNGHKNWVDWMKALGMLFIIWGHAFPETENYIVFKILTMY